MELDFYKKIDVFHARNGLLENVATNLRILVIVMLLSANKFLHEMILCRPGQNKKVIPTIGRVPVLTDRKMQMLIKTLLDGFNRGGGVYVANAE